MIAFGHSTMPDLHENYYCVFAGRRDGVKYRLDHEQMMKKYAGAIKQWDRVPDALSGAMGNQSYIARFSTEAELQAFEADIYDRLES